MLKAPVNYNAPSLLRRARQLARRGQFIAAGRALDHCLRNRCLAELEHFDIPEFDDGTAVDDPAVTTRELCNQLAWYGHTDAKALLILYAVIEAIDKAMAGSVERYTFDTALTIVQAVLDGEPKFHPHLASVGGESC